MKKIIPTFIIALLLSTYLGVVAQTQETKKENTPDSRDFSHTVFAEYATGIFCEFCHYAREALDEIYTSGEYPFYYITLIQDVNTHAAARINDYNIIAYPTVAFDYGYNVTVGGYDGVEAEYRTAINECGARTVADIDVTLDVLWLGDATMDISVKIKNNEATPYTGHLHVYVCEIESSLGWNDTTGHPYTLPFLDYAINEQVSSIPSGDVYENAITWDGHDYTSGYGVDFGTIQYGNIAVIAAVFNNTWHQGYSKPPGHCPFDAYYVDETTGFIVADTEPHIPSNPDPENGATDIDIHKTISWIGGGTPGTIITYDVFFGSTSSPPKVSANQSITTYNPGTLTHSTTYYWKIIAWDQNDNSAEGPLWSFTTMSTNNSKPDDPSIIGPDNGKPDTTYQYNITGIDPDSDMVSAYVQWGDNTITDWTAFHDSGESFSVSHSWATKGTYSVQVKIKDEHGAESGWTTLKVTMPTSFKIDNWFLQWLFEHFPHAFPILRHLVGY